MNRHVKLFPSHGPCDEPANPIKDDDTKKISSALSTMPIIPLARTQLEELVGRKHLSGTLARRRTEISICPMTMRLVKKYPFRIFRLKNYECTTFGKC